MHCGVKGHFISTSSFAPLNALITDSGTASEGKW